jgi:hypothetical protein
MRSRPSILFRSCPKVSCSPFGVTASWRFNLFAFTLDEDGIEWLSGHGRVWVGERTMNPPWGEIP